MDTSYCGLYSEVVVSLGFTVYSKLLNNPKWSCTTDQLSYNKKNQALSSFLLLLFNAYVAFAAF